MLLQAELEGEERAKNGRLSNLNARLNAAAEGDPNSQDFSDQLDFKVRHLLSTCANSKHRWSPASAGICVGD